MNYDSLIIQMDKDLRSEILESINGDLLGEILQDVRIEVDDKADEEKHLLANFHYKVEENISPEIFQLFEDVRTNLEFEEEVDYYIKNDQRPNAFAITKTQEAGPNTIVVNSGLLDAFKENELKFIIGHEMGHFINDFSKVNRCMSFLYPDQDTIPMVLRHKFDLWQKLSEMTSDRFGLAACGNDMHAFLSAHLKLISGLDPDQTKINLDAFLEENINKAEYFKENPVLHYQTHPHAPLRIAALNLFANSSFFPANPQNEDNSLEAVNEKVNELSEALQMTAKNELEGHLQYFIAASGLITANLDEPMNQDEYEKILRTLATYMSFPESFLKHIYENLDPDYIFKESIKNIVEIDPSKKSNMFIYLTDLVVSDQKIQKSEIDFLYDIGDKFGFTKGEISEKIAKVIREVFVPNIYG